LPFFRFLPSPNGEGYLVNERCAENCHAGIPPALIWVFDEFLKEKGGERRGCPRNMHDRGNVARMDAPECQAFVSVWLVL
jgi:hypothetical protein